MARVNFTAPKIATYKCDEGKDQSFLWDLGCPWLGLRATPSGDKAYIFQSRLHGKPLRITIGKPSAWTIPEARAEATKLQRYVDQGTDPRKLAAEEKAKAEAEATEAAARKVTAQEAWNIYIAARKQFWSAAHYQDHLNLSQQGGETPKIGKKLTKPGPLASLLHQPLADITAEAVADWMKKEAKTRETATLNSFRKFKAFISWCIEQPQYRHAVHDNCCTASIVKDVRPESKTKKKDCLQREQLALWFEHVRQISNPCFSAYLQALLLTGARRSEMALLKWTDVNFEWKTLRLYDTEENTGERLIPLTPYLATVLRALPVLKDNEYVFSSPTAKDGHIVSPNKPHTQALEKAGLPHVSLHGLRRSFGTLAEWLEIPTGIIAQIRGHKPSATVEKHYMNRPIDLLRLHHNKIEDWMLEQAGIKFKKNPKKAAA